MRVKDQHLKYWGLGALLVLALNAFLALRAEAQESDWTTLARRNVLIESDYGSGSGVIFRKDSILTAAHLIGPNMKVNKRPARVVKLDKAHDLMLLYAPTDTITQVTFALDVRPLEPIVVVGNPLNRGHFFTLGYAGWMDKEILNTSNLAMAGFSGAGAYNYSLELVGIFQAGLGNCAFGFTIAQMATARRVITFLANPSPDDPSRALSEKKASREKNQETRCTDKSSNPRTAR